MRRTDDGGLRHRSRRAGFRGAGRPACTCGRETFFRCSADFARTAGFPAHRVQNDDARLFVSLADMPPVLRHPCCPPSRSASMWKRRPRSICSAPRHYKLEVPTSTKTDRDVTCDAQAVYGERRYPLLDSPLATREGPCCDGGWRSRESELVGSISDTLWKLPGHHAERRDGGGRSSCSAAFAQFQALSQAFTTPAFDRLLVDRSRTFTGGHLTGGLPSSTSPCPPTTCPGRGGGAAD